MIDYLKSGENILKILCIIVFLSVFTTLLVKYFNAKDELEKVTIQLAKADASISIQNESIEKLKLETKSYKSKLEESNKKLAEKYKKQDSSNMTCEAKLELLESYTKQFQSREK